MLANNTAPMHALTTTTASLLHTNLLIPYSLTKLDTTQHTHTFICTVINKFTQTHTHPCTHDPPTQFSHSLTHSHTMHTLKDIHTHSRKHSCTHILAPPHIYTCTHTSKYVNTITPTITLSHTSASQSIAGLRHQTRCRKR